MLTSSFSSVALLLKGKFYIITKCHCLQPCGICYVYVRIHEMGERKERTFYLQGKRHLLSQNIVVFREVQKVSAIRKVLQGQGTSAVHHKGLIKLSDQRKSWARSLGYRILDYSGNGTLQYKRKHPETLKAWQ